MTLSQQSVTHAQFAAHIAAHPERRFQLINGEIIEKVPTEEHAHIAGIIAGELHIYLKQHPHIRARGRFGVEARFKPIGDDSNDRLPDVFFRYTDQPRVTRGAVDGVPDLAVEIKSPDDTFKQMRATAAFYLHNGARMVWLVFPSKRLVEVYQPDADVQLLQPGDTIVGDPLLPGFRLPITELLASE